MVFDLFLYCVTVKAIYYSVEYYANFGPYVDVT